MFAWLKALFGLVGQLARYLADRQLLGAGEARGRAAAAAEAKEEIETRVDEARAAVAADDPARDERLRDRFDRARRAGE